MPMQSVTLRSGVDTEKTLSQNEAGISRSQLVRFRSGMIQKYGGWNKFTNTIIASTVRDLHAWQGLQSSVAFLGIGATQSLTILNNGTTILSDVTPQTNITNSPSSGPNFSISSGSSNVTVVDVGSSASVFDTVYFNTPVAIGNLLLSGSYAVASVLGADSYIINSSILASTTITSSGVVPIFTSSAGNAIVSVVLPNHGFTATPGLFQQFIAPTTVDGLLIQGPYQITTVTDSTSFTITASNQSSANATVAMNSTSATIGKAQLVYYVGLGPPPSAGSYGAGLYGAGLYGFGTPQPGSTGTPITATDWTMDNWGEILLACPKNGPVYSWAPDTGFRTATVVPGAPFFNGGIFVSMPQQILVCWASVQASGTQDPLIVRWSNAGDFTNFVVSNQTTAGSFHIPTGSVIRGGMQAPSQGVIWTDIDCWVMSYVGGVVIFNFTRVGSGCGLVGPHAAGVLSGTVYWMGIDNLFTLGNQGVMPMPCSVWDAVFQNINTTMASKVKCATNSLFNEVTWFYPSLTATENDSYVKYNISENVWDYGTLSRTAWTDVTVLGNPIGTDTQGVIYQHENGNDAAGMVLAPSFQTGYWQVSDGNDIAFIDFIIPDFIFGTFAGTKGATISITFFATYYLGDTPTQYGPYTFTSGTEYINVRIRARFLSMQVTSNDLGSFWRLGRVRFRYASSGRR